MEIIVLLSRKVTKKMLNLWVMNEYIVLARKYRPESFETLIGQDNIAQTLKNSISRGQLAHAYLFCGPRGVGKTTTARIFAKMINCSSPLANGEPCGECESCRSFAEGRSYCIHEMDAASNNSVDDIKELIDKVRVAPQVGRYSVYIIDEVHMLSQQAFNAFLKTLEEPPEYAIFILATTEKHKILPTILSRCQTYDFNRMSIDNIVRNLRDIAGKENITVDDESLHVIALKADGAMRDALTIFDQTIAFCGTDIRYEDVIRNLNVLDYEYCFGLVNNFLSGDYASALRSFDEILAKGFNALHFISALSSHFRDLMVARAGGVDSLLELADSLKAKYHQQAAVCSERFLYEALGITTACEQGYKAAVNPRLHIEFALMKLCFLNKAASGAGASAGSATGVPQPNRSVALPTASGGPLPLHQAEGGQSRVTPIPTPAPEAPASTTPASTEATANNTPTSADATSALQRTGGDRVFSAENTKGREPQGIIGAEPIGINRRAPIGGVRTGVSVKAIVENEQKQAMAQQGAAVEDRDLTDEEIRLGWNRLCEASKASERLFNALSNAKLGTERRDGAIFLTYAVTNESLKMWLTDKNARIEGKYRELVGSSKVRLVLDVQPEDPNTKVVVSSEEKAREMMASNPKMKEMISDLGLEIK